MTQEQRSIPAPEVYPGTEEYWNGAREGKLLVRYCNSCGNPHHYPRPICPHCGSDDTYFKEAEGGGAIYSFSVMWRAPVPYAIAYVTLDGTDISMMTNIVDCDLSKLEIGQKVKLKFSETEGDGPPVPTFTPA
ncbi:DNA-binding protein [Sneathiella sp. P13V-1]|uniref:Zn-ribbon domain-containing OB-fold protein n=1 Tax=Sneathiella sp. P13V-1 TaxID=2697366 RepID=UPI00187B9CAD|nr:Zn-ribbon domain-containing OB-fold protein [Sneathiella sp. P13V-1]MBE7635663.1 DNA-binding protein [Sneathiella sp. P13V-1]